MQTWVKVLTFVFFTPLWTLIVLDDPDSTTGVKVLATILLGFYFVVYWLTVHRTSAALARRLDRLIDLLSERAKANLGRE